MGPASVGPTSVGPSSSIEPSEPPPTDPRKRRKINLKPTQQQTEPPPKKVRPETTETTPNRLPSAQFKTNQLTRDITSNQNRRDKLQM